MDDCIKSLLRAGDHIVGVSWWDEKAGQKVSLKLWLALSEDEKKAIRRYLKASAEASGAKVRDLRFYKWSVDFVIG